MTAINEVPGRPAITPSWVAEIYKIAISPEAVARAIAYAIGEPPEVDINESWCGRPRRNRDAA